MGSARQRTAARTNVRKTTGVKQSLIHLLMFGQAGIALMAGILWRAMRVEASTRAHLT